MQLARKSDTALMPLAWLQVLSNPDVDAYLKRPFVEWEMVFCRCSWQMSLRTEPWSPW